MIPDSNQPIEQLIPPRHGRKVVFAPGPISEDDPVHNLAVRRPACRNLGFPAQPTDFLDLLVRGRVKHVSICRIFLEKCFWGDGPTRDTHVNILQWHHPLRLAFLLWQWTRAVFNVFSISSNPTDDCLSVTSHPGRDVRVALFPVVPGRKLDRSGRRWLPSPDDPGSVSRTLDPSVRPSAISVAHGVDTASGDVFEEGHDATAGFRFCPLAEVGVCFFLCFGVGLNRRVDLLRIGVYLGVALLVGYFRTDTTAQSIKNCVSGHTQNLVETLACRRVRIHREWAVAVWRRWQWGMIPLPDAEESERELSIRWNSSKNCAAQLGVLCPLRVGPVRCQNSCLGA